MKTDNISIIIPAYNTADTLARTLEAICNLDYPPENLFVIVVDDASVDHSVEIAESFRNRLSLRVLCQSINNGAAAARNRGWRESDSDWIAFLDSDLKVDRFWLRRLKACFNQQSIRGVMGWVLPPPEWPETRLQRYIYARNRGAFPYQGQPLKFKHFLFNNTLLRRELLEEFSGFDDNFTTYGEDTELALRLWKRYPHGLYFCAEAVAWHYHARELADFERIMFEYGRVKIPRLLAKHPGFEEDLGLSRVRIQLSAFTGHLWFLGLLKLVCRIAPERFSSFWFRLLLGSWMLRGFREKKWVASNF